MALTGARPSLQEEFKYIPIARRARCCICGEQLHEKTNVKAERALWIYLKYGVVLHPQNDFVCKNGPNTCDEKNILDKGKRFSGGEHLYTYPCSSVCLSVPNFKIGKYEFTKVNKINHDILIVHHN